MDRDLGATVQCSSESSACDYPVLLTWQGATLEITRIRREWREPDCKHYQVETENGQQCKLAFIETGAHWLGNEIIHQHKE